MRAQTQRGPRPSLRSFLESSPWGSRLAAPEFDRVVSTALEETFEKGAVLAAAGEMARYWIGVLRGLVVQSVSHADGCTSFISAVGEGAWFGEGTLIKRASWGYDAVALQQTRAVLVPLETFELLRETNIPFNHFLQVLMNARLATYIGTILTSRHASTETRVATALMNLLSPKDHDGPVHIRLSQSELALLAGTSRQRVNDVLKRMASHGLVRPKRHGVDILNPDTLRAVTRAA
jgi:CRP/FNR family transcriptional regulator, cyclic AMP receptor protein